MVKYEEIEPVLKKNCTEYKKKDILIECSVSFENLISLMEGLLEAKVTNLQLITGVDVGENVEVIYHFSYEKHDAGVIAIKTSVPKSNMDIPSITKIYPAATILECEQFEMLGIEFKGHPDLKRTFLDKDSPKTPLRRDNV